MHDTIASLLKDKSTPASVLIAILFNEYGNSFLEWEPETIVFEIREDFGVEISNLLLDKIQAGIIILTTDFFSWDWHTFNSCIHALNGESFDYEVFNPIDAEELVATMPEVEMLTTNFTGEGIRFSDEIDTYAGLIFSDYGLFSAPIEFPSANMPILEGEYCLDSQLEKKEALAELYTSKKDKIIEYMDSLRHCLLV